MNTLIYPLRKKIRSKVIADFVRSAGYKGAVCFSCGNASQALIDEHIFVVDISDTGPLRAQAWFDPAMIRRIWPDLFDATSGHLPAGLMVKIAAAMRADLGPLKDREYMVPTGSGETIVCLGIAYPETRFRPVYNLDRGTIYEPQAPLNDLVFAMFGAPIERGEYERTREG